MDKSSRTRVMEEYQDLLDEDEQREAKRLKKNDGGDPIGDVVLTDNRPMCVKPRVLGPTLAQRFGLPTSAAVMRGLSGRM